MPTLTEEGTARMLEVNAKRVSARLRSQLYNNAVGEIAQAMVSGEPIGSKVKRIPAGCSIPNWPLALSPLPLRCDSHPERIPIAIFLVQS